MQKKKRCKAMVSILCAACLLAGMTALPAKAAPAEAQSAPAQSAGRFDPAYYAATYPDVVAALGTDSQALLNHYLEHGMKEGRRPYRGSNPGAAVEGVADTTVSV